MTGLLGNHNCYAYQYLYVNSLNLFLFLHIPFKVFNLTSHEVIRQRIRHTDWDKNNHMFLYQTSSRICFENYTVRR